MFKKKKKAPEWFKDGVGPINPEEQKLLVKQADTISREGQRLIDKGVRPSVAIIRAFRKVLIDHRKGGSNE